MPLAVFVKNGTPTLGKVFGDHLVDLKRAAPKLPLSAKAFLAAGREAIDAFNAVGDNPAAAEPLDRAALLAPVPDPEKFLAIGMNYADHGAEARALGLETPKYQLWFNKQVSCINAPYGALVKPAVSDQVDYEGELAVVIGKTCRNVPRERAREVIGGYMVANDVSARDWQFRTATVTLGKSFDTHGPTGPWLTLDHEIDDPCSLGLRTWVNGDLRQRGNTRDMIFDIYDQIAYLSQVMTLRPGDILATGTPAGVGVARDPKIFLQEGDVVRVEIEELGHIENTVVADG
jgi:2-keto-4-pentenoate hydratase/2-oxohepta-3-ene-1,7-dioic acid hydratase in catechol pathway